MEPSSLERKQGAMSLQEVSSRRANCVSDERISSATRFSIARTSSSFFWLKIFDTKIAVPKIAAVMAKVMTYFFGLIIYGEYTPPRRGESNYLQFICLLKTVLNSAFVSQRGTIKM